MARTDLILSLVRAARAGDQSGLRRVVEAMAADERQKQHGVFADRLVDLVSSAPAEKPTLPNPASSNSLGLFAEQTPRRLIRDLTLHAAVERDCADLVEEQARAELLRSHGVEPRNRVLLVGPPGNGKTSLAEALASELAVPFLRVRYESIITSFLGETSVRLSRLFDLIRPRRCVLFFDEFDAIAKERGDEHETGEIKRIVSALLLNLDDLPSHVVVVVATNHPELLDRAAWRRFQLTLSLERPTPAQVQAWLHGFETRQGIRLGLSPQLVRTSLKGANFSDLEEFCRDVQRRVILAGPGAQPALIARDCLKRRTRLQPARQKPLPRLTR